MVATQAPVVARSPDLATRPTEGLPWRLPPGDLRSGSRRGLETRAEPSPARNRQVIPGPFLRASRSAGSWVEVFSDRSPSPEDHWRTPPWVEQSPDVGSR